MFKSTDPFLCSFADEPDQPRLEPLARFLRVPEPAPSGAVPVAVEPERLAFGKYSGQVIQDVARQDSQYLDWLLTQPWLKAETRTVVTRARELVRMLMG